MPNVRGSSGYGKSYLKLDNGMLREGAVKDIGALLDEFTARLNGPMLFGGIILAAMLGVVVFWVFGGISSLIVGRWKE